MYRIAVALALAGVLALPSSAFAEPQAAPAKKSSSTTKKVVWTVVGAGAGFAAGVFLGLNKFDDAINSDRKVWTTAVVGAAAGGLGGWLIGRQTAGNTVKAERGGALERPVQMTWDAALAKAPHSR